MDHQVVTQTLCILKIIQKDKKRVDQNELNNLDYQKNFWENAFTAATIWIWVLFKNMFWFWNIFKGSQWKMIFRIFENFRNLKAKFFRVCPIFVLDVPQRSEITQSSK